MEKQVLNTPGFVFNSTKSEFRKKYYNNLDKLKEDFIIDESDLDEIRKINLDELKNTLEEENWSEFKGYIDAKHTENSHESHNKDHHDKDSHRDDRTSFARFDWEGLLTKYGERLNEVDFVNGIISKNK